jgi:hypothetical protein
MGIRHASVGTRSKAYLADWVRRYDHKGNELGPLPPAAGGASGFWVTSAIAMVRYLAAFGGGNGSGTGRIPAFLVPETLRAMFAPPGTPAQAASQRRRDVGLRAVCAQAADPSSESGLHEGHPKA